MYPLKNYFLDATKELKKKELLWDTMWRTHHHFSVCWYEYASHVYKSSLFWWGKHLEGFGEKLHICVSIFPVQYLEDSPDSVSSNLSDWEEDYYLLLYPLFSPASNSTLTKLCEGDRKTKRELADGTVFDN